MKQALHLLIVEDSASDAGLLARHIEQAGYALRWERVETPEALEAALGQSSWDAILCDYSMPGFSGLDALRLVQATGNEVPFIFVSGTMGEDIAVEAMRTGARDYVVKGNLKRLVPAIEREFGEVQVRRQKRQAEAALRESEHKYRQLFEGLNEAAFLVDVPTGRIVEVNRQAEALLGLARSAIMGRQVDALPQLAELGPVLAEFTVRPEARTTAHREAAITREDHSVVPVSLDLTRVLLKAGELVLVLARDLTERRLLEKQFREAQKMEGIGQLAGGVAHDFNNLLTIIRVSTELALLDGAGTGSALGEYLRQTLAATERAAGLTRQLLLFSRKQVPCLQPLDLNDAVRNLAKMLRRVIGEDIALQWECAPALPLIQADFGMVEHVLLNLVVNARDAMPHGGKLIVRTSVEEIGADYAQLNAHAATGQHVCLSVADTGSGIPREILPRIFEPFFTTKDVGKGTGLGLATAYGIVQQHRGWIDVSSEVGQGTVFRVYFPVAKPGAAKAAEPVTPSPGTRGAETILLVEDEVAVRATVRKALEGYGYTVREAAAGLAALEVWREHRARIDLVLTDMVMPGGMTGPELAAKFQADEAALPVIFMSGYSADVVGNRLELQEGVNFLQKPFTPQKLADVVRQRLKQKARAR